MTGGQSPRSDRRSGRGTDALFDGAQLRAVLDAAPDAMVIVDPGGRIVLVNSQLERLFGFERHEVLGQPIEVLVPERYRGAHIDHRLAYGASPRFRPMGAGLTLFGQRKDGSEFPVEISLSPAETTQGRLITAAIRDVTDRQRAAQALTEKNVELERAAKARDQFLASMSHELRTPLNAILGFTGTLLMKLPGPLTADQESQLRTVQASARHLLSLINDLLDLARIESGNVELQFEDVSCQSVVTEVAAALSPMAKARGLTFTVVEPERDITVQANRRALSQIVINLANNAIKFTERGAIRIEFGRCERDGQAATVISVADTGVGIRPEDEARLFRAFEQLESTSACRHQGTGLGLHVSQKLATLLGGYIRVDSAYGQGSTFTLVLPERSTSCPPSS